jgi:hypothetical protein
MAETYFLCRQKDKQKTTGTSSSWAFIVKDHNAPDNSACLFIIWDETGLKQSCAKYCGFHNKDARSFQSLGKTMDAILWIAVNLETDYFR